MCAHMGCTKETQQEFLMEWEHNAVKKSRLRDQRKQKAGNKKSYKGKKKSLYVFALSGVFTEDGLSQYHVCKNAYELLIGTFTLGWIEKWLNMVSLFHHSMDYVTTWVNVLYIVESVHHL